MFDAEKDKSLVQFYFDKYYFKLFLPLAIIRF